MGITYGKKDKVFRQYGKPSLLLDFARRKKLLDTVSKKNPITFTRASSVATYVDADGLIKKAPVNLALYSEQFDNSYWGKDAGISLSANQTISPDGKQTADKVTALANSSGKRLYLVYSSTINTTYTFSIYLKMAETRYVQVSCGGTGVSNTGAGGSGNDRGFKVDLLNCSITINIPEYSPTIQSIGNGWCRVSITITTDSDGGSIIPYVWPLDSSQNTSYTGDGVSGFYVWGAQLEEGSVATEYIKTTSTISGAPRFDHEPTSGNLTTNLLKYSEFQASWTTGNVTKTLNATTDPFGGNNAAEIEATAAGTAEFRQAYNDAISGETYTFSVYAKANSSNFLRIGIYDSSVGWKNLSDINLSNGTTPDSATITAVGSGWYRIQITATLEAAGANMYFYITSDIAGSAATGGESVYIYGAQFEQSSTAGTYVRTLGETRSISDARAESKGLLIEEARTNIFPYGDDMSQIYSVNINKTANNAVAPDGTMTATKIENSGSSTVWFQDYSISTPASGSGTYTLSVYVKGPDDQPDDYYGCRIALLTSTGGNNTEVSFGLTKEWKRISVTKTYTTETGVLRITPIIFRNSPGNIDAGKVVPSYVWVWGAQWEQGSFPTSYIPTNGSTVQRTADIATIEGNDFKRTNLIGYSEQFDAGWSASGASVLANAAISPDGQMTADLIYPASSGGGGRYMYQNGISAGTGIFSFSIYAKAEKKDKLFMYINSVTSYGAAYFDLSDASTSVQSGTTATPTATIEYAGNGWYRCTYIIGTSISWTSGVWFGFGPVDAKGNLYATSNNTDGVYFWGAQLERSDYPTDYIPTTTTSASVYNWYNESEGAIAANYEYLPGGLTSTGGTGYGSTYGRVNSCVFTFTNDYYTYNNQLTLGRYQGNGPTNPYRPWASTRDINGSGFDVPGWGSYSVNLNDAGPFKTAISYASGSSGLLMSSQGTLPSSVVEVKEGPPSGLTGYNLLRLDRSYDGSVGCKHLKEIKYWKLGLSGSTLQLITGDE